MRDASVHAADLGLSPRRAAEASVIKFWQCAGVRREDALKAPLSRSADPVHAFVNEGRWVVGCPDCGGAQFAAREDRRFMCTECANLGADGAWRRVVWPDDVAGIEGALRARPRLRNQNWQPGESVEQLVAETAAGGPAPVRPFYSPPKHAHDWPGKPDVAGMVECRTCDLVVPHSAVLESLEQHGGADL